MAPAKRYPDFPKRIFGLKCTQHRVFKMRDVLGYYSKRFGQRATKERLLKLLVNLEDEVEAAEDTVIRQWLSVESSTSRNLTNLLNATRGIQSGFPTHPPPPQPQIDCSVCMESLDATAFPQTKITELCNHNPTVCRSCLSQSLDSQIPDVAWDQVRCPECPETLPYGRVKVWASAEAFERYDQKSLLAAFRDMPNSTMCLGPSCGSGQIHETGDDQPIMTCNICQFKTCFTHNMPWHSGQTCADYDVEQKERTEQEAASEKLIAETTKKCPNPECGHGIEKNEGCDHMTCKQCRYEFCYICLAPWRVIMRYDNTAHAPTCQWHSNQLNAREGRVIHHAYGDMDEELEVEE